MNQFKLFLPQKFEGEDDYNGNRITLYFNKKGNRIYFSKDTSKNLGINSTLSYVAIFKKDDSYGLINTTGTDFPGYKVFNENGIDYITSDEFYRFIFLEKGNSGATSITYFSNETETYTFEGDVTRNLLIFNI